MGLGKWITTDFYKKAWLRIYLIGPSGQCGSRCSPQITTERRLTSVYESGDRVLKLHFWPKAPAGAGERDEDRKPSGARLRTGGRCSVAAAEWGGARREVRAAPGVVIRQDVAERHHCTGTQC
jgi:hypothetical protein